MNQETNYRVFTIPNIISFFRLLLLIPLCMHIWQDNLKVVSILLVVVFISDYMDGYIARHFNQISELGKILDPVGDKISFAVVLIVLYLKGSAPLWIVSLVIGRDLALFISSIFVTRKYKQVLPSNMVGKITVNILSILVLAYIYDIKILETIFTRLMVFFIVFSMYSYAKRYFTLKETGELEKLS
ncbi:CDP-alcohol phosphatidyltransferase family protein [candidate division KSB1 bacterium]|nr:CDP-alcohol phosphatidyltransferase family protein [candidate division KSB1 bacterium]